MLLVLYELITFFLITKFSRNSSREMSLFCDIGQYPQMYVNKLIESVILFHHCPSFVSRNCAKIYNILASYTTDNDVSAYQVPILMRSVSVLEQHMVPYSLYHFHFPATSQSVIKSHVIKHTLIRYWWSDHVMTQPISNPLITRNQSPSVRFIKTDTEDHISCCIKFEKFLIFILGWKNLFRSWNVSKMWQQVLALLVKDQ